MKCPNCGAEINDNAAVCQFCGKDVKTVEATPSNKSSKDWLTTLLLLVFLGVWGAHRFYTGSMGAGILRLCTLSCCWILWWYDLYQLLTGKFTDGEGKLVTK